ncbi:nuclear transport factor 2 family protein [Streptomyces sp. Li-HN-5-11]|uniref:nuclear transport factor 2 family protein n=1 Tax=Streptomyces sp. Li-HN-5-11 TaxID=3075432 RepID=UPI0028A5AC5B|nr:nuclear transport factor 2 family protein [Streptomyces sp. Li-HN-5-11]WNM33559.1 nuclear transport factor 2 family protein [Streptomyces sp. Li-HN-5-11]
MSDSPWPTPAKELAGYLRSYIQQMGLGSEDPGVVIDRYHTPDIEWYNDGTRLDRDRLVAHARPARKNAIALDVEVHDALVAGDRVAARYTLHSTMRKGRRLSNEMYLFGELAPDGRLRRVHSTSRDIPDQAGQGWSTDATQGQSTEATKG